MDPYIFTSILSYGIDDVEDSIVSSLSDKQKRYLISLLPTDKHDRIQNATERGHLEKVKMFIDFYGKTIYIDPFMYRRYEYIAIVKGHRDIVRYFYDKKPSSGRSPPLGEVIYQNKDIKMMELLLHYKVDLNQYYTTRVHEVGLIIKETPLTFAVMTNNAEMVKLLLENGAHDCKDYFSFSEAIIRGNEAVLKEMVKYVPDSKLSEKVCIRDDFLSSIVLDKLIKNTTVIEEILYRAICVYKDERTLQCILKKGYIPHEKYLMYAIQNESWSCAVLMWKYGVSTKLLSWEQTYKLCVALLY